MDASRPADRVRFMAAVEHGACSDADAQAVAGCGLFVPETIAGLLDLSSPATYAACAARVLLRNGQGRRG